MLTEHPDLTLCFTKLPEGQRGRWYPDLHTIVLDEGLTQAERRCTLLHELVHRMRGDCHVEDDREMSRQERDCHLTVARLLIPLDRLRAAMRYGRDPDELAEELWVDLETLQARILGLSKDEAAYVRDVADDDEMWGVA